MTRWRLSRMFNDLAARLGSAPCEIVGRYLRFFFRSPAASGRNVQTTERSSLLTRCHRSLHLPRRYRRNGAGLGYFKSFCVGASAWYPPLRPDVFVRRPVSRLSHPGERERASEHISEQKRHACTCPSARSSPGWSPPRGICRAIETARWRMPRDLQAGFAFLFFLFFFRSREIIQREDINVACIFATRIFGESIRFDLIPRSTVAPKSRQRFAQETPRIEIPCTRGFRRGYETSSLALSSIDATRSSSSSPIRDDASRNSDREGIERRSILDDRQT